MATVAKRLTVPEARNLLVFADLLELEIQVWEAIRRQGVLSSRGERLTSRFRQDLRFHFRRVQFLVGGLGLETLASTLDVPPEGDVPPEILEFARATTDTELRREMRIVDSELQRILETNLIEGFVEGANQFERLAGESLVQEQAEFLGPVDPIAVEWARQRAATLVVGISETTRKILASDVAEGIAERDGVPGLARRIRESVRDMSRKRARVIATTEMNAAMSEGTFFRMKARRFATKTTVLAPAPCPICIGNHDQGEIPVDDEFSSGHLHTPFHPNCRCSTVPGTELVR